MKKVNLLLAAVVAASMNMPAQAGDVFFNGYLRSGVSAKNITTDDGNVAKLGRAGYENNTYGEISLGSNVAKVDDTVWTINTTMSFKAYYNRDYQPLENSYNSSDATYSESEKDNDGNPKAVYSDKNYAETFQYAFRQAYLNVKGLFDWDKDANVWIGKRYYRRDSYLTGIEYFNISGFGAGIQDLQAGDGKLSLAWFRRDDSDDNYKFDNYSQDQLYKIKRGMASLHIFDVQYNMPLWSDASFLIDATYLVPQRDAYTNHYNGIRPKYDYGNGSILGLELTQGMLGGFNKTVLTIAHGSNARWGNFGFDSWIDRSGASDSATRWSLRNFGDIKLSDNIGLAHHVYGYYVSGFDHNITGDDTYKGFNVIVHPYFKLTKMTKIYADVGAYAESTNYTDGTGKTSQGQRYTLGYAISPDSMNFWSRPEIRIYATYLHGNDNSMNFQGEKYGDVFVAEDKKTGKTENVSGKQTSAFNFGVMFEAWW